MTIAFCNSLENNDKAFLTMHRISLLFAQVDSQAEGNSKAKGAGLGYDNACHWGKAAATAYDIFDF